jgi:hypothetical protein
MDRKRKIRLAGGAVASPVGKDPARKKKKKARILKEEAVDPDMAASGGDGIGRAML